MSKIQVNQRKNGKYAEEREWAYDLIANSTGTTTSEMAELMAEQFGHDKGAMSHTLHNMVENGSLKVVARTVRKGKYTHIIAAVRKARPKEEVPMVELPIATPTPAPATNGSGVYVLINTVNGPVQLTVEQAKALNEGLSGLFK